MENIAANNLLNNSYPDLIWELETCLGLNYKSETREEHVILREGSSPFSKIVETECYFSEIGSGDALNQDILFDILQQVTQLTTRLAFISMNARAYNSLVLIPGKSDYLGIGETQFKELFGILVNANLYKRQDISPVIMDKIEVMLKNPRFIGKPLTLEIRTLSLIYVALMVLRNTQTASFLAQFVILQEQIATAS